MPPDLDNVVPRLKALNDEFLRQFPGVTPSSGYRDPFRNAAVGGAKYSRHMNGDAIDYTWRNLPPDQQTEALKWWSGQGAGGIGVYGDGSIHVDLGQRRAWGPDRSHSSIGALPDYLQTVLNDHRTGRPMAPTKIDPEYERLAKLYGGDPATPVQDAQAAAAPVAPRAEDDTPDYSDLVARYAPEPSKATTAVADAAGAPQPAVSTEKPKVSGPLAPGVTAFARGAIDGLPIVGPWINRAAEMGAAKASSMLSGTSYEDEQRRVNALSSYLQKDYPNATMGGNIAGAVGGYAAAAAPAMGAQALGLVGGLGTRMGLGAVSNAAISGADSVSRQVAETGNVDPMQAGLATGVGGAVGGLAPLAGRAIGAAGNKLLGMASESPAADSLARAAEYGIPIRSDQASTSPFLNKVGQMLGMVPGSGMAKQVGAQRDAFTRAMSEEIGQNTSNITRDTLNSARKEIGGQIEAVTSRTDIPFNYLVTSLDRIEKSAATAGLNKDEVRAVSTAIDDIVSKFNNQTQVLPGKAVQSSIATGSPLDKLVNSPNTNVANFAQEIKSSLLDGIKKHATPEDAALYEKARAQYSNLVNVIAPLAVKGVPGEISPALVQGRINATHGPFAPDWPIVQKAEIGQRFLKPPKDSGTPLGEMILKGMVGAAGAGVAGAGGYYMGVDPLQAGATALALGLGARGGTMALSNTAGVNRLLQAGSLPVAQNFLMDQASQRLAGPRR